jgi:molecular chaperone DnaK (HSP70)
VAAITKKDQGDINEYNVPIISAGTKLPHEATKCFTPIDAQTTSVTVKLYDGHRDELSKDCKPLHQADVKVQPTDDSNNDDRIEFKISMDVEGLVHIKVRDKLLNKPVPIKLKFHSSLSDSDIQERRNQLLARHKQPAD